MTKIKFTTFLITMASASAFAGASCKTDDGGGSYDTGGGYCGDGERQGPHEECDGELPDYYKDCCFCTSECERDCVSQCEGADSTADGDGGVDDGTAEGTGESPPCDPTMVEYSCNGVAYGVYKDTASSDRIMEVVDNSIGSGRVVACVGDLIGTPPGQHHIETLMACGPNASGVEEMVRQQCIAECEEAFTEGSPFRSDFAASGRTWEFEEVRCRFGSDLEYEGVVPLDDTLINSIGLAQAVGSQGCAFGAGIEDVPGTSTGAPCGESTCAEIDCSSYEPTAHVGHTTTRTVVRSWSDTDFTDQLLGSMMLPFCGEGLYVWDEQQTTRSRFEGLGAGELYYEMGFRSNDRLLSVQEYIPPTSGDPDSSDLVGSVYPLTTQAEMITAVDALDLLEPGEHYFLIKFKRGTSNNWQNWVRVVDIID